MKTPTRSGRVLLIFFFFLTGLHTPSTSIAQSASYHQLSFVYGTDTTSLSDWGAVDFTFTGHSGYKFLNLSVDTVWAIENAPIVSIQGTGVPQTIRLWFPLPDSGVVIPEIAVGLTFTDSLKTVPPSITDTVPLSENEYFIAPGSFSGGGGPKMEPGKGEKQKGGAPAQAAPAAATHAAFPNQEAGANECAPAAVSNSLNFLNSVHPDLNLPVQAISIDTLKQKLDWNPVTGVPRANWVANKRAHTKKRKMRITTLTGGRDAIKEIPKLLADKQDVEIDCYFKGSAKAHVMSIVNCVKMADGKYALSVRHDSQQGKAGGLVTEMGYYDPKTGDMTGALSTYKDFFIVVECPSPVKPQTSPKQPKPGKSVKSTGGISGTSGGVPASANNAQIQVRNMVINNFSDSISPPPLGSKDSVSFTCSVILEISVDTGTTFTAFTTTGTSKIILDHTEDIGPTSFFETEMVQMDLTGGTLPPGVIFRESPVHQSTGLIQQSPAAPGVIAEANFMHLHLEMSMNGGMSWIPFDHVLLLEGDNSSGVASIPAMSTYGLIVLIILILSVSVYFIRRS